MFRAWVDPTYHGSDTDDDPDRFRLTLTFDAQADGRTILTLPQIHPT